MSDEEIKNYLNQHNYIVDAQDCLMKVLNTSRQITDYNYDFATGVMTIITLNNIFSFTWTLDKP